MRREQEDTLSLSFTDVLTCVLGAAIALFLIFVALITLSVSEGETKGNSKGYSNAKLKSIQEKINKGYATSTVKIISDNHTFIKDLKNKYKNGEKTRVLSDLRFESGQKQVHGIQFDFFEKLPELKIEISEEALSSNRNTTVYGFATVGGMSNCLKFKMSKELLIDNGNAAVFRIGPTVRHFIDTRYEHTSCS